LYTRRVTAPRLLRDEAAPLRPTLTGLRRVIPDREQSPGIVLAESSPGRVAATGVFRYVRRRREQPVRRLVVQVRTRVGVRVSSLDGEDAFESPDNVALAAAGLPEGPALAWVQTGRFSTDTITWFSARTETRALTIAVEANATNNATTSFSVPMVETTELDKLQDFQRYCERGAWEKAFRVFDEVVASKPDGMVPATGGFRVPVSQYLRQLLTTLSPEGRRAYDLFYGPKAEAMWKRVELEPDPVARAKALRELYDGYLITKAGGRAADRLGDAAFERGDFGQAAVYWQTLRETQSSLEVSALRLDTKRAIALARAGRWGAFDELFERIRSRYGAERVRLGGRDSVAVDYLRSMRESSADSTSKPSRGGDDADDLASRLALPESDEPEWRFTMLDEDGRERYRQEMQRRFGRNVQVNLHAPAAAFDGERVYVNWFGIGMALDATTGKLLWRTAKLSEVMSKLRNMYYYIDPDRYTLTVADGRLFMVSVDPRKISSQAPYRLRRLDPKTGKTKWSSEGTLGSWSFSSEPLVEGDTLYVVAHSKGKIDQHLLVIDAESGKLRRSTLLGTPVITGRSYGRKNVPNTRLLRYRSRLIALTNNGAVLAVDAATGTLEWAFTRDLPQKTQRGWNYREPDVGGAAIIRDGVLYFKETDAHYMFALDLDARSLVWRRRVDAEVTLTGIDDKHLYLLGNDFGAVDRATSDLRWAPPVLVGQGWRGPIQTHDFLYTFTPRGVFEVDKSSGLIEQKFRGADRESVGGAMFLHGDRLICVSNTSVTTYRLRKPAEN